MDVVEVNIDALKVRVLERGLDAKNADAFISLAVLRRGIDTSFFACTVSGKCEDGDKWTFGD